MARLLLGGLAALLLLASPASAVTTTFTGSLDTDWNKAGNWSNGVPTLADDAVIPGAPAAKVAQLTAGATGLANSVTVQPGAQLHLIGVGLTVDGGAPSSLAGTVNVNSATLTLAGATDWSAGAWTINTGSIVNDGTLTVSATSPALLHTGGAAPFVNPAGRTINKTGPGEWAINVDLQNQGTMNITNGALRSRCFCPVPSAGTFNLGVANTWTIWDAASSSMTLAPGAAVNGGTLRLDGDLHLPDGIGATAVNPATMILSGGDLITAEDITLAALTTDGAAGSEKRGAGTVTAGGPTTLSGVTFTGGATTLTHPTLTATGSVTADATTLNLTGADKHWSAGQWQISGSSSIVNTGKLTVSAPDALITHGAGQGQLVNPAGAVIEKTGTGQFAINPAFDNDGTINVRVGSLRSRTFGVTAAGAFNFDPGTTWVIWDASGSQMDLVPGATVNGGTLVLDGNLSLADGVGATAVDPANVVLSGGDLITAEDITLDALTSDGSAGSAKTGAGTVTAGGPTVLSNVDFLGGATTLTHPTLSAVGPVAVNGSTLTIAGTDATWSAGQWHLTTGDVVVTGKLTVSGVTASLTHGGGAAKLHNQGTLVRSGSGTWTVNVDLRSSGTFDVLDGAVDATKGVLVDGGVTTVADPADLGVTGQTVSVTGGTLKGVGTVVGTLANSGGTVAPGASPGQLDVIGDYTQGPGGTLQVEIDGDFPLHDRLAVTGTATLGGTVAVVSSVAPPVGAFFDVLSAATVTGTFASLTGGQLSGRHFEAAYPAGLVRLAVVADAAPPAPQNTTPPSVTPTTATAGDVLTCNPGAWSGGPTLTTAWLRDGALIGGQTGATYTTTDGDAGKAIACRVSATNGGGTVSADSNAVTPAAKPVVTPTPTPTPSSTPTPVPTAAPTPSPTPAPPSPTAVAEQQLAAAPPSQVAGAFGLPSTRKCVSRRRFPITLSPPRNVTIKSAQVRLNGRRVKVRRSGSRFKATIDLRGLPKRTYTVKIRITTGTGRRLTGQRRYRTCVPRR